MSRILLLRIFHTPVLDVGASHTHDTQVFTAHVNFELVDDIHVMIQFVREETSSENENQHE
jgi:hypothetical protein